MSEQQWQQADAIGMLIGMLIGMRALLEGSRAEKSEEAKVGRAGGRTTDDSTLLVPTSGYRYE